MLLLPAIGGLMCGLLVYGFALSFDVPVEPEDDSVIRRVDCEGIVVRVIPEEPEPPADTYEIAVFFTTIDAESLHHLESYLETLLTA